MPQSLIDVSASGGRSLSSALYQARFCAAMKGVSCGFVALFRTC
jgi:hypothetical protein